MSLVRLARGLFLPVARDLSVPVWFALIAILLAGSPAAAQDRPRVRPPRVDAPAPVPPPGPGRAPRNAREEEAIGTGTGFLLSTSGYIATNHHVIDEATRIEVRVPGRTQPVAANVVVQDLDADLAIIKVTGVAGSPTAIAFADPAQVRVGQDAFTLGYPLGDIMGSTVRLSTGTIDALFGIEDDPRVYQISNPIQPGNSGGPLFNKEGQLVGVVVAQLDARVLYERAGIIPQNINFAVKASMLRDLVAQLPEGNQILTRANTLQGLARERQVEALSPNVVKIVSYRGGATAPPAGRTTNAAPRPAPPPASPPPAREPATQPASRPPAAAFQPPAAASAKPAPPPSAPPAPRATPSVEGLSADQVIQLLGKPSYVLEGRDGVTTWFYESSGATLRVFFFEGKASIKRQR
jgi:S1-C subfamily serine protease